MKRRYLVLVAALLAGCGGGGGSSGTSVMAAPEPAAAAPVPGDAFTAAMVALVRSAPDSTEPTDVEAAAPSMPDGGEPVAAE